MNCIDLMVEEHVHIKRMLAVIRKYCYKILKGEKVQYEDFFKIIDFVRNYADKHHHGKEESMLFNRMMEELGPTAEKLVRHGMNVEHDLGRLHMQELEAAVKRVLDGDDEARLDVIANAISYTHLLHRHIAKEDDVVYKYAERSLSKETLDRIDLEGEKFEKDAKAEGIQDRYLAMVDEFEAKVGSYSN
ncbi:MAG: hemerythrin domain-containing protein [Clostridia bacterium]|nr:hemerythrin domain-containing protein [Clostridia bacterium]